METQPQKTSVGHIFKVVITVVMYAVILTCILGGVVLGILSARLLLLEVAWSDFGPSSIAVIKVLLVVLVATPLAISPWAVALLVLHGRERPLLIGKYLRELAPLFAAFAVMMCTAMVIIVISVMGGFLNNMREATKSLSPEVTIVSTWTGFPYYEELLEKLRASDQVAAATPVIKSAGIIKFGEEDIYPIAQVYGVYPQELKGVTRYSSNLYWTQERIGAEKDVDPKVVVDTLAMAMDFKPRGPFIDKEKPDLPGIVPGIEVFPFALRDEEGQYHVDWSGLGKPTTLTIVPVSRRGGLLEPKVQEFRIVNEFKSGLYEIDDNRVYVGFELLQRMMRMDGYEAVDPNTGELTGETVPARTSEVLVKGRDGVALDALAETVKNTLLQFTTDHPEARVAVQTWEERHARLLNAVGNEKGLITFLFAFISLVAALMIATTFYMIVLEKTRDIGVLRAIGVSRFGIAFIFQGYGLVIGGIGTVLGVALAYTVVFNLNELQYFLKTFLGESLVYTGAAMGGTLLGLVAGWIVGRLRRRGARKWMLIGSIACGVIFATAAVLTLHNVPDWRILLNINIRWEMWSPEIYYFDQIPEQVNRNEIAFIACGAMVSCLLGATIPAFIASRLNPVEALRYE